MTLTTSSWDRPIQGVSQQPPKVRIGGQCSVQENALSSVVNGLIKRPGTFRINTLSDALPEGTSYYYYNRGTNEEYFIITPPNGVPRVFDIEGDELVVENELPDDSYVESNNPRLNLRLSTISDFTFIANKEVTPAASGVQTDGLGNIAILNVQFADYGRTYSVSVDGTEVVSYEAPTGEVANHITYVDTTNIANYLYAGKDTDGGTANPGEGTLTGAGLNNTTGIDATWVGNTIIISKTDGSDFTISTTDGADGRDLFVIKNTAKSVSDLPLYAPDGYLVKIVGEGNSDDDDYWLIAESSSGDTVTWRESRGPSQSVGFDKSTMPVTLIRDRFVSGKAVFKLKEGPWEDRLVGDADSNPFPSFVQDGVPITSVGTFQNRLYFTAGESSIYSRSNEFFDFFRSTVRAALDDDPIDVYADTNQVNILENSAVLDGDVVFFSSNGQFVQKGDSPITKDNATLQYASTFENTASCQPVAAGDVIFFGFEYGRFAGIREFYTDSFTDTKRARPVTDHVDEYITGTPRQLATSTNRNQLFVLADNPTEVYVYNWLWQGQERVQSSWSKWVFDGNVRFIAYDNETVYFLVERGNSLELEFIETGDPDTQGLDFPVRLDRQFIATAARTTTGWSLVIPYIPVLGELALIRGEGCLDEGVSIEFDRSDTDVTISEELADSQTNSVEVVGGIRYTMVYEPTMPFIKDRNGRVIETDRLILNDVNINYDKTGLSKVIVKNDWGNIREYEFNGRAIGGVNNIVGFAPLQPGTFSFPIRQDSDRVVFRIETDSHLPFQLRDMEWRGKFNQRGRRV